MPSTSASPTGEAFIAANNKLDDLDQILATSASPTGEAFIAASQRQLLRLWLLGRSASPTGEAFIAATWRSNSTRASRETPPRQPARPSLRLGEVVEELGELGHSASPTGEAFIAAPPVPAPAEPV